MTKAEWGTKRTCPHCGAKFYDMMKSPIVCPKCAKTVEPDAAPKPRRSPAAQAKAPPPPVALPEAPEVEELEVAEGEEEATETEEGEEAEVMEDASDLGEDEDDVAEVLEHVDENPEDEP